MAVDAAATTLEHQVWLVCLQMAPCSSKGGAAAQRAAGLAERQQLTTGEHAQQAEAKRAKCEGWLAAQRDTWAEHCSLQQSQLHCSLCWQANPPTCKQHCHCK